MSDLSTRAVEALERIADALDRPIAGAMQLSVLERIADSLERQSPPKPDPLRTGMLAAGSPNGDTRLLEEMEIGVRAYNAMKRSGAQTVGDVVVAGPERLLAIVNFGQACLEEVVDALLALGYDLEELPAWRTIAPD